MLRLALPAIAMVLATSLETMMAAELTVFVSSFAKGEDGAIHTWGFNTETGEWSRRSRFPDIEHPFYLALSPDTHRLYSIHAPTFGGSEPEQVAAFAVSPTSGELKPLNRQSAKGTAACYLTVDSTNQTVLVANYLTGSVGAIPIADGGALKPMTSFVQHAGSSVNPDRQQGPHAHCFVISPNNRFAYAADLGLDQILCYRIDPQAGTLQANNQAFVRTRPGAGPRHAVFHPQSPWFYAINELENSVTHFDWDPESGTLFERNTVTTLPGDFEGVSHCADLQITPDGRFLYGTNRGHDSIAVFEINTSGELKPVEIVASRGKGPQNLAITPDGQWLICANMPGNNVATFRIDRVSGKLSEFGTPESVKSPSCLLIHE